MDNESRWHTAGIFDVRNIIGALLGIYGVILILVGIVGGSSTRHSATSGDSTNIWMGVALVLVAAFFLIWARLRPTIVDDVALERHGETAPAERATPGPEGR